MKKLITLSFLLVSYFSLSAQKAEPIRWIVTTGVQTGCEIEIKFTAELLPGWHLYAPEHTIGLPLTFEFKSSTNYSFSGNLISPEPYKEFDKLFDADIYYYKEAVVSFTQRVKITAGHDPFKVEGTIYGQVCYDDGLCIPLEYPFSLELVSQNHCH